VILAWVIFLVLLLSSLIVYLEQVTSLRIIELKTMQVAHKHFLAAEKAVLECEHHLTNLTELKSNDCFIQSVGHQRWLISSKTKPGIHIGVVLNEKTGVITRVNWRQAFE
jgi:hypothetical protein